MTWLPLGLCPRVLAFMGPESRAHAHFFEYQLVGQMLRMLLVDGSLCVESAVDLKAASEYKVGDLVWEEMSFMRARLQRAREV